MNKNFKILLAIAGFLILLRIALPFIVLKWANNVLATMDGYYGYVHDIDIHLYRGAYVIDSVYINKTDSVSKKQTPFMAARQVDLSVEWASLFKGRIVGELEFREPFLKFVINSTELGDVEKDTADFRALLNEFMPLKINRFDITNGKIIYVDGTTTPKVDIQMDQVYVTALNLSSVEDTALLPSFVRATANVYQGFMVMNMKLDPLSEQPLFDMNVSVENTHLPDLNNFFKAYAKIDVNKGTFGMYSEIAAKDGKFKGYVKPIIKDLDVVGPSDRDDKFMEKVWENIAAVFGKILENRKADQVATKIPLEGSFDNVQPNIWRSLVELLKNAFIQALFPSIDEQITIASVNAAEDEKKNIFQKVFGGKKDEKKDKEKKK